jgi:hypothetical protein
MVSSGEFDKNLIESELFLEFYGALMGDGWIGKYYNKKYEKTHWIVGFSGHSINDRNYFLNRISYLMRSLFGRKGYLKNRPKNSIEFIFGHKDLIIFMNEQLGFPIGKKGQIGINQKFVEEWEFLRYIVRGLFDTDGSFYLDRDERYKRPYPILEISTVSKKLRDQILEGLKRQEYRVIKHKNGIRIKGVEQVDRWFKEIDPKNEKHLLRYNLWLNSGPVAQFG